MRAVLAGLPNTPLLKVRLFPTQGPGGFVFIK